jgi:hypothetical protein
MCRLTDYDSDIKAASQPDATSLLHWRKEVVAFHRDFLDRMNQSGIHTSP